MSTEPLSVENHKAKISPTILGRFVPNLSVRESFHKHGLRK